MSKISEIYEGWSNFIFPNKEVEEQAKKRISICLDKTICKKLSERNYCTICHCYMPAKVRSPKSKCLLSKW